MQATILSNYIAQSSQLSKKKPKNQKNKTKNSLPNGSHGTQV